MQKVLFGVPSKLAQPCLEFQQSAQETVNLLLAHGIESTWLYKTGDPYVHKARNEIAAELLNRFPDYTDLFFVDDDVGWEPDAAVRVILRHEDIICGIYPKKCNNLQWPVELARDGEGRCIMSAGLVAAYLAPTGFLRMKRHVIEKMADHSGIYPEPTGKGFDCWDIFRTGWVSDKPQDPNWRRGRWWGEDFFWSVMAKSLGFDVWIDPDITFSHRGSYAWNGNFGQQYLPTQAFVECEPTLLDAAE